MLAAMTLALTSVGGTGVPASCRTFSVAVTPNEQASDAALVSKAYGREADSASITSVLRMSAWRIIWAVTADDITTRVFFIHGSNYRGKWDAVGEPRARYLGFARKLNVPAPLARCFADRMQAEPSI